MTDSNPESNANGNQDVTNQLTVQTNSNDASTSVQRATCNNEYKFLKNLKFLFYCKAIQTGPNVRVSETHHITGMSF